MKKKVLKALVIGSRELACFSLIQTLINKNFIVHLQASGSFSSSQIDYFFKQQKQKFFFLHRGKCDDFDSCRYLLTQGPFTQIYIFIPPHFKGYQSKNQIKNFFYPKTQYLIDAACKLKLEKKIRFYQNISSTSFNINPANFKDKDKLQKKILEIKTSKAYQLFKNYRIKKRLQTFSGISLDSKSLPYRQNFLLKKILKTAVQLSLGKKVILELGNLQDSYNWYQKDFALEIIFTMQSKKLDDCFFEPSYICSLKKLVEQVFLFIGKKIIWSYNLSKREGRDINGNLLILADCDDCNEKNQKGFFIKNKKSNQKIFTECLLSEFMSIKKKLARNFQLVPMQKTISLWFCDGWWAEQKKEIEKLFLYNQLKNYFPLQLNSKNPDFIIFSCFGKKFLNFHCHRIFFTGENINPNFKICDFALSFNPSIPKKNCYYHPFGEWKQSLLFSKKSETIFLEKQNFCNFIYSNLVIKRENFFFLLSKYKKIDAAGARLQNMKRLERNEDKIDFLRKYKFTIAFENTSSQGYHTEKIIDAFAANSVPIYYGNPKIADYFNPEAFINCHDFDNFDSVVSYVKKVDQDETLYRKYLFAPVFCDNKIPAALNHEVMIRAIGEFFLNPPQKPVNSIWFRLLAKLITYDVGKWIMLYTRDRNAILQGWIKSKYLRFFQ